MRRTQKHTQILRLRPQRLTGLERQRHKDSDRLRRLLLGEKDTFIREGMAFRICRCLSQDARENLLAEFGA